MVEESKTEKVENLKSFNETAKGSFGILKVIKKFLMNIVNFFKGKYEQKETEKSPLSPLGTTDENLEETYTPNTKNTEKEEGQAL